MGEFFCTNTYGAQTTVIKLSFGPNKYFFLIINIDVFIVIDIFIVLDIFIVVDIFIDII